MMCVSINDEYIKKSFTSLIHFSSYIYVAGFIHVLLVYSLEYLLFEIVELVVFSLLFPILIEILFSQFQ